MPKPPAHGKNSPDAPQALDERRAVRCGGRAVLRRQVQRDPTAECPLGCFVEHTVGKIGKTREMLGGIGPGLLEFKPDYLVVPSLDKSPPPIPGNWFEFKLRGGGALLVRAVFYAEAEHYTATDDVLNRQVAVRRTPRSVGE